MSCKSMPTFHLRIIDAKLPDDPRPHVAVECLSDAGAQHAFKPNIVKSPLNDSYKDLEELGRALYRCLFDGRIGDAFSVYRKKYCDNSDREGPGLRVVLDFWVDTQQRNMMINLPWELLHDDRGWLLLDPKLSIVRRLHNPEPQAVDEAGKGIEPPMRVLLAYAEPPGMPAVNVAESFECISQTVQSAIELVTLEVLPHATAGKLKSRVKQGLHVIHLLGHGDIETQGIFYLEEAEAPTSDILTGREFKDCIEEAAIKPKLVVLVACHSGNPSFYGILGLVTRLLDAGVETVVSMQTALYTDEARDFSQAFYHALVESYSVDDAVRAGRRALQAYQSPADAGKFIRSGSAGERETQEPVGRWRPVSFTTLVDGVEIQNSLSLPAWSVPTLFLQGEGWLGPELPASPYAWPADHKEMIYVEEGRFYMDKYPVTREQYRSFASDTGRPIPRWKKVDEQALRNLLDRYFHVTEAIGESWEPNLPATNVTTEDALAYAAWAGKHLPTPAEWQQAALSGCSDKRMLYPWGNDLAERVCNTREGRSHQLWPVILSGERFDTCSAAGVCDVVGNASEWTPGEDGQTYVCGGSFKDYGEKCTVQTCRLITNPHLSGDSIGFRCAANLIEWKDATSKSKSESAKES